MNTTMNNKRGFAVIIVLIAVVIIAVVGFVAYKLSSGPMSPTIKTSGPAGQASIQGISVAKGIDAKGNPVGIGTTFSSATDKQIYVVLSLQNASKATTLAYTRYFNGIFVDSKVIHPSTDGAAKVFFAFEKGVGGYPKGTYRVVSYVNGKRSLETTYTFN